MMSATLYLIPTFLANTPNKAVFPTMNLEIVQTLRVFVVENEKTARRFIKKMAPKTNQKELEFYVLNKKTTPEDWFDLVKLLESKQDVGLMSEAGLPAVADPGSKLVRLAQEKNYKVKPLVGPSSIFLALMASGLNGQNFQFHAYLPIDKHEQKRAIKQLESWSAKFGNAHIFMETPYRSNQLFASLLQHCFPSTQLCVAANLTADSEFITTKSIALWRKEKSLDFSKIPCIFILESD